MVSREIREEGTEPPYPGLTSTTQPWLAPLAPLAPAAARSTPCLAALFCSTARPHVTGVQTASGAAWRYQAFLGVCGRGRLCRRGRGGHVAGEAPFLLSQ